MSDITTVDDAIEAVRDLPDWVVGDIVLIDWVEVDAILCELKESQEDITKQRDSLIAAIKEHKKEVQGGLCDNPASDHRLWSHIDSLEGGG